MQDDKRLPGGLVTAIKDVDYEFVAKQDMPLLDVRDHFAAQWCSTIDCASWVSFQKHASNG